MTPEQTFRTRIIHIVRSYVSGIEAHAKPVKKKCPCKAKDVVVPNNECSRVDHGDIGFLPAIPNSGGDEVLAKPVQKRAPRKKKLEIPHDIQCLGAPLCQSMYPLPSNNEDGCQVHVKPVCKTTPKNKNVGHALHSYCHTTTQCSSASADTGIDVPGGPLLLELLPKVIRQRSRWRTAGQCMSLELDGCIVDPLVDNATESCGFTCTPRKRKLPDLNKPTTAQKSPKNTSISRKPSVAKIIHKANVGKQGDSMFQGLGSLLTVLCKFAEGDIASISDNSITSNVVSIALQLGPHGGSVSATKLDDPNVTTFPTCCTSVMATVDKHAFSSAESDYIRRCDLKNSSNVASVCIVLDCIDSIVRAESSAVDNEKFVHRDVASEVTGAFLSNHNDPMLKDEKMEGVV
jgi:hypothetical protein